MPEIAIANSSCLIILQGIKRLHILKELYSQIYITETVKREFGEEMPSWIKLQKPRERQVVQTLLLEVGKGEAETIALGLEKRGYVLIIDDKKARRVASELGLRITGTLGILVKAKRLGVIKSLEEVLKEMEERNFRISKDLKEKALKLTQEE